MKKLIEILSALVLCGGIFISCNTNSDGMPSDTVKNAVKQGTLVITISGTASSDGERGIIPSTDAAAACDKYRIFIYNGENDYRETVSSSETLSLSVDEGTYNIVLVAGKSTKALNSDGSLKFCVLGSGYVKDVSVEDGKTTSASITIRPVDVTFTAPETVANNEEFNLVYTVKTRNPLLTAASDSGSFSVIVTDSIASIKSGSGTVSVTEEEDSNTITETVTYTGSSTINEDDVTGSISVSYTHYAQLYDSAYSKKILLKGYVYGCYDGYNAEGCTTADVVLKAPEETSGSVLSLVIGWETQSGTQAGE